jgi:hypothetical protein
MSGDDFGNVIVDLANNSILGSITVNVQWKH